MTYLPFLSQLRSGSGKHVALATLPPAASIAACILHDDAEFLRSLGAAEISAASERFSAFTIERGGRHVLLLETGMGTAQTSVLVYELAAYLLPMTPLIKLGTCGILDPAVQLGSVIVAPFAAGAEGVSHWNAPDAEPAALLDHLRTADVYRGSEPLLRWVAGLLDGLPFPLVTDRGVVTTDALYALYNHPNALGLLGEYRWDGVGAAGIEMEVSSFYSSARACGLPAAALIVGSWSLDQQLRLARGEDPQRSRVEKDCVHANERAAAHAVIAGAFKRPTASSNTPQRGSPPSFLLNGTPPPTLPLDSFYRCAQHIHREVPVPLRGHEMRLPVLAEGFAHIRTGSAGSQQEVLRAFARVGKAVVCPDCTESDAAEFIRLASEFAGEHADESLLIACREEEIAVHQPSSARHLRPDDLAGQCAFFLRDSYLLRRYLQIESQRHNILLASHLRTTLPIQSVEFVGLGPARQFLDAETVAQLEGAEHVVAFDRTLLNIIPDLRFRGKVHAVCYVYDDFSANLSQLNAVLASLHAKGVTRVTVLIEGNPEIYDFAEGLSMDHREFTYREALPLVYISCRWIEEAFGLSILDPSYALLSGFNARHGAVTTELLASLDGLLDTDATLMIMEMYCGDVPLVMAKIAAYSGRKSVFLLTNMFSPDQRMWFIPTSQLDRGEWAHRIKGRFTTLVVVENDRLARSRTDFREVLRPFEPPPDTPTPEQHRGAADDGVLLLPEPASSRRHDPPSAER